MPRNERGVALPMAMIMLVMLTAMMVAFAALASTEPTIASNQQRSAQALALAGSGLELAMWALTNPADPRGIDPTTMTHDGTPAAAPYDGATYVTLGGTGGFTVRVTWEPGNGTYERTVTAVGWTPSKDANFVNPHRKIQAVVQQGVIPPLDPPCVICVNGEVQVNGSAASFDSSHGACPGKSAPTYASMTAQAVSLSGNSHPSFTGNGTSGTAAQTTTTNPTQYQYASDSLSKFKAYAQAHGTYYNGSVSSLPTGTGPFIVFVDTVDGSNFGQNTLTSNDGSLSVTGSGTFNGTVIVAGSADIGGSYTINGLVYSLNDLNIHGTVNIQGAVVSENRRDSSSSNVDTSVMGNVALDFNCSNIRNIPFSSNWVVKIGGYLETAGY
jgi:hypothetical protein